MIVRIPYSCHIWNTEAMALSWCRPLFKKVMEHCLRFLFTLLALLPVKTITISNMHCLRFSVPTENHHRAVAAAIHKPPPDWKRPQEDPITHGSEPLSLIWDGWTSVLPTWEREQPLKNAGIQLWTRLCLRRVCYEERTFLPAETS